MIHLYDLNKNKIRGLIKYKDLHVESVLVSGDKTLSFLYPARLCKEVKEEGYIRTKTDEFVIKEINPSGDYNSITCKLNLDELEGKAWEKFESVEQTIENCLNFAIVSTGWTCELHGAHTKKRTIRKTNCSALEVIKQVRTTYRVGLKFDTFTKKIHVYEAIGSDKGVYFTEELNARNISTQSNSYDFFTRIIAIGKNTTDEDGNDTTIKVTIENHQYSPKVKTLIWKDERYTIIESLTEDATYKLNEISKPYKAIEVSVVDLAKINPKYSILAYELGDTVRLISKDKEINEKQRIIITDEYLDEPHRNTVQIANSILTFEDIQQEYEETVDTVNNITSDNGTISESAIKDILSSGTVDKVIIQRIEAVEAVIGTLEVTYAKIAQLDAINANIKTLTTEVAKIGELEAKVAKIGILEADVGYIKELVNGNLTSDNIHSLILTSAKVTVENGFIKNAMIESLDVSKINAGTISTNKFIISSENGGIQIVGATQQFRDSEGNVRLQLGQDTKGAFNFILRGEDGTSVLIDHTGIKEKAITDDLIKNSMIAENAVGQKQINYTSFVEGFNDISNTSFIKATHIKLDNINQTLDVAFDEMTTNVQGNTEAIGTNTTAIEVEQGRINTLISNTTITKEDGSTVELKDDYNATVATVNSIRSTIGSHTTSINSLTGQVDAVDTKTNEMQRTLDETVIKVASLQTELSVNLIQNGDFKNELDNWDAGTNIGTVVNSNGTYFYESIANKTLLLEQDIDIKEFVKNNQKFIGMFKIKHNATAARRLNVTFNIFGREGTNSTTIINYNIASSTNKKGVSVQSGSIVDVEVQPLVMTASEVDLSKFNSYFLRVTITTSLESTLKTSCTNIKFIKPSTGEYATIESVSELSIKVDGINARVTSNKISTDGVISDLDSKFTQRADSISSTVTANKKDTDGKITSAQSSITQLSNQIATKVDVNGVKSTIEQNPTSVKIGFNKINNTFEITPDWVYSRTSAGKKSIGFNYGRMYMFNPSTEAEVGRIGINTWINSPAYGLHIGQIEQSYLAFSLYNYSASTYTPWLFFNFGSIPNYGKGINLGNNLYGNNYKYYNFYGSWDSGHTMYDISNSLIINSNSNTKDFILAANNVSKFTSNGNGNHSYTNLDMHGYSLINTYSLSLETLDVQDIKVTEPQTMFRSGINKKTVTKTITDNTEWLGEGQVFNGRCEIELPIDVLYSTYSVFLTAVGRNKLYLTEKNDSNFIVECDVDCKFEYMVKFTTPTIFMYDIEEQRRFEQETKIVNFKESNTKEIICNIY